MPSAFAVSVADLPVEASIRWAGAALEVDRSTFHDRSRRCDQARIEAICETRVRYRRDQLPVSKE
jgi:hypothetical protein